MLSHLYMMPYRNLTKAIGWGPYEVKYMLMQMSLLRWKSSAKTSSKAALNQ